jgi:hypothetical protein
MARLVHYRMLVPRRLESAHCAPMQEALLIMLFGVILLIGAAVWLLG